MKTEGPAGFEPRSPDIDRDDELATEGSNPSGITEKQPYWLLLKYKGESKK